MDQTRQVLPATQAERGLPHSGRQPQWDLWGIKLETCCSYIGCQRKSGSVPRPGSVDAVIEGG